MAFWRRKNAVLAALVCLAPPALADAPLFAIDRTQLPFDLGPGAPGNSPARVTNLPSVAANSQANPANSSATRANSPRNPANEKRVIFDAGGQVLGYYVPNAGGTLNLFDRGGGRVAYRPRGTQSLFGNDGRWCGTVVATQDGGMAFGVTPECERAFRR